MTDYPTAADIQTTRKTLLYLHSQVDTSTVLALIAREVLWDANRILDALDDVPGLHTPSPEPEPEPKPTAAEVLRWAHERLLGLGLSAEMQIIGAAVTYAEENPRWFRAWHEFKSPVAALDDAKTHARDNRLAWATLIAAREVATCHPELFGGAS